MTQLPGLRAVRDSDADALCALIGGVFAEYPGCVLELQGFDAELLEMATVVAARGGEMWVVERAGDVVACCGWAPIGPGVIELKRLYVASRVRRQGLGRQLIERVDEAARAHGASTVELWSDTRFVDAHRLYEACGFIRAAGTRDLHDLSNSTEYQYRKQL